MIKKSLIVLALSTSIISSAVYASERFGPSERPGPSKVKITLATIDAAAIETDKLSPLIILINL